MNERLNPVRPQTSSVLGRPQSGIRITKQSAIKEKKRQAVQREAEFVDNLR